MNFLQRNLFTKLRSDNFGIEEELEPMTTFKNAEDCPDDEEPQ